MQEKVNFCIHLYKQARGKGNEEGDFLGGLLQIWTETVKPVISTSQNPPVLIVKHSTSKAKKAQWRLKETIF